MNLHCANSYASSNLGESFYRENGVMSSKVTMWLGVQLRGCRATPADSRLAIHEGAHHAYPNSIADLSPEVVAWRHDFHAAPELAYEEVRASELATEKLSRFDFDDGVLEASKDGEARALHGGSRHCFDCTDDVTDNDSGV